MADNNTEIFSCWRYESPLGTMVLAADGESLIGAWWLEQKHYGSTLQRHAVEWQRNEVIDKAIAWLDEYFAGKSVDWQPPMRLEGSPWQRTVWRHLSVIAYGATTSYGAIARAIEAESGRRVSAQAVGNAVGRNPISLFVPCHRVVGADGSLTGYAAGLRIKQSLLLMEHQQP